MVSVPSSLRNLIRRIPSPGNYFQGVASEEKRSPFNILLFSRMCESDLYTREGSPYLHRRHVLILNLETAGVVILDGRWLKLLPGEYLLIFPHQIHAFADIASSKMCWLFITFDLAQPETLEVLRHRAHKIPASCLEWLTPLLSGWKRHPARAPFLTGLILSELLANAGEPVRSKASHRHGLAEIVARLHTMLETEPGLRIKELARRLGLSESHLRAEFRYRTHLSLGHYLRQFRLNRAALLLTTTAHSIGEIAALCGFESLYSFSRGFRTAMGVPPRTYRMDHLRASRSPEPAR